MISKKDIENKDEKIRLEAYRKFGFTEKAFNDDYWLIRYEAYEKLGFTEQALLDEDEDVLYDAYCKLGSKYMERLLLLERNESVFIKDILDYWKKHDN